MSTTGRVCIGCGEDLVETAKAMCKNCRRVFDKIAAICHEPPEPKEVVH